MHSHRSTAESYDAYTTALSGFERVVELSEASGTLEDLVLCVYI